MQRPPNAITISDSLHLPLLRGREGYAPPSRSGNFLGMSPRIVSHE
jgi:hypothetical protein